MTVAHAWWALGWTLVHASWILAALGVVAVAVRWMLRRAGPGARHRAAGWVLALMAAVPIAVFAVVVRTPGEPAAPVATASYAPPSMAHTSIAPPLVAARPAEVEAEVVEVPPRWAVLGALLDWAPAVWLAGLCLVAAGLVLGAVRLARVRLAARPLRDRRIEAARLHAAAAHGLSRPPRVHASDRVDSPIVVGLWRAVVLLPAGSWRGWSSVELEMVLLHEFAHVRRGDAWAAAVQSLVERAMFFHPAVRWTSSWLRLERECCCDAAVVAHTGNAPHYVHTLLALAAPARPAAFAALAMGRSPLVGRVRSLLHQETHDMTVSRATALTTLGLVAVSALLAQTQAQVPPAPPAQDPAPAVQPPAVAPSVTTPSALARPPAVAPSLTAPSALAGQPGQGPSAVSPPSAPSAMTAPAAPPGQRCIDCHRSPHHPPAVAPPPTPGDAPPRVSQRGAASRYHQTPPVAPSAPTALACVQCHRSAHGDAPHPTRRSYKVKAGDTLVNIAQRQLGSAKAWRSLVEANPGMEPRRLRVGQVITLPPGDGPQPAPAPAPAAVPPQAGGDEELRRRVQFLEQQLEELRRQLEAVKAPKKRLVGEAPQPAPISTFTQVLSGPF